MPGVSLIRSQNFKMRTVFCMLLLVLVEIQPSTSKPISLQDLVKDIKGLQAKMNSKLPRYLRNHKRRSTAVSHRNLCREETVTVDLQQYLRSPDMFYPSKIVQVRCASGSFYRPRGLPTCNNGNSDCVTKKRKVWFMRTPKNHDCRFARMESLTISIGCECQSPVYSG